MKLLHLGFCHAGRNFSAALWGAGGFRPTNSVASFALGVRVRRAVMRGGWRVSGRQPAQPSVSLMQSPAGLEETGQHGRVMERGSEEQRQHLALLRGLSTVTNGQLSHQCASAESGSTWGYIIFFTRLCGNPTTVHSGNQDLYRMTHLSLIMTT